MFTCQICKLEIEEKDEIRRHILYTCVSTLHSYISFKKRGFGVGSIVGSMKVEVQMDISSFFQAYRQFKKNLQIDGIKSIIYVLADSRRARRQDDTFVLLATASPMAWS